MKQGKKVRVIVTVFNSDTTIYPFVSERDPSGSLMKDLREKYLRNIANEQFIDFIHFKLLLQNHAAGDFLNEREKLGQTNFLDKNVDMENVKERTREIISQYRTKTKEAKREDMDKQHDFEREEIEKPIKKRINEIIHSLSTSHDHTVLLIDEIPTVLEQDWSDISTPDNVEWLFSMSPGGVGPGVGGGDFYQVKRPTSQKALCHRLCKRYRNSSTIRDIHNWWLWHSRLGNIDLSDEILLDEGSLPKGPTAVWIQADSNVTDLEVLEVIRRDYAANYSVTLTNMYPFLEIDGVEGIRGLMSGITKWCKNHGWKVTNDANAQGTEDQCFVLLKRPMGPIFPEYMSRAKNLLIIVTTLGDASFPGFSGFPAK